MIKILSFIFKRLKEPSTYSGMGITTAGVSIWDSSAPTSARVVSGIMILGGFLSALIPESPSDSQR